MYRMEKFTCQLVKNSNYHVLSGENNMSDKKQLFWTNKI